MGSFVQVTSCHFHYDFIKSLFPNFVMIFFIKTWMETMIDSNHCDGDKFPHHILYKFSKIFQIIRNISVPVTRKWQMPESTHCKEMPLSFKLLLLQLGFKCSAAADKLRFILLGSQCLRTLNQTFPFFFFFGCFCFRMRGNLPIYRKMSISRLVWGDRWKLHGEMQRHAIVLTYMFMTNDRCEDSFV